MIDQRNANPLVVTGTPTLVTGALSLDTNQGSLYNGPTSFAQAVDSTSLSITSSLSLEFFVKFASLPGATRDIVSKASSYAAQLSTAGKLLFRLDNGASNVTITSNATLSTNTWYHIVCVYNDGYAGAQEFGKTDQGASQVQVDDDNGNNKGVCKGTLLEAAILDSVSMFLAYADEIWTVEMRAVVYSDLAGVPDDLVTQSSSITNITSATVGGDGVAFNEVTFPVAPVVVSAGSYHIGYIADTISGIAKAPLVIGRSTTGSTTSYRPDSVNGASDPFGSVVSTNSNTLAISCGYTAIARTGLEGTAAIYINGAFDNSSAYTADIGDNANALQICPSANVNVDEVSVWNRVLSPVEIATHYLAR